MASQSTRKTSSLGVGLVGALFVFAGYQVVFGGRQPSPRATPMTSTHPSRGTPASNAAQSKAERMGYEMRQKYYEQRSILAHQREQRAIRKAEQAAARAKKTERKRSSHLPPAGNSHEQPANSATQHTGGSVRSRR